MNVIFIYYIIKGLGLNFGAAGKQNLATKPLPRSNFANEFQGRRTQRIASAPQADKGLSDPRAPQEKDVKKDNVTISIKLARKIRAGCSVL